LSKSVFECLRESIEEVINLNDVWIILALSFVQNTFEFSKICVYTISPLFNVYQLRCSFTCLIRVEVYTRKLIEDRLIVLNSRFLCLYELRKNHCLNSAFEVEINVVELGYIASNSLTVHSQLCLDAQ